MEVGYGRLRVPFVTEDRLDRERREILIVSRGAPFRHFESHWTFRDAEGGSRIAFSTRYEFASRAFDILFAPVFDRVVASLTQAFVARAEQRGPVVQPKVRPPGQP